MRRSLLVNGALLVAALGTFVAVWVTRDLPTTSELSARKDKLFPSYARERVSRLSVKRDGVTVELLRDASVGVEGDFRIVAPWPERADIATVSSLLGSLELATFLRDAGGVDRAQAGLASPRIEIAFEQRGERFGLRIGAPAPAPAGAAYAELLIAGEPARQVTISAGVVAELDVTPDALRDPRLLEVSRHDLARVRIRHDGQKLELEHGALSPKSEGVPRTFFMRRNGEAELVDRDGLERLLAALARLVSTKLVDAAEARRNLADGPSQLVVELERLAKAGPPITIQLGGRCPTLPEQPLALIEEQGRPARAGCVPADVSAALRVGEEELAISTLFSAQPDEVEELQLSSSPRPGAPPAPGTADLVLKREGAAFKLQGAQSPELVLDAGNRLLESVLRVQGTRQPDRASRAEDFAGGWARVYLNREEKTSAFELVRFSKPRPDGSLCARRELDAVVLCVEAEEAKRLRPDPTLLRSLRIGHFAAAELKTLAIVQAGFEQRVERTDDGSFALREPRGFDHDGALVTDAVQAMGALEAERWVAASPRPEHGLARPWLRVRAELSDRPPLEVQVGAATGGGYFAKLEADPGVFVLARAALRPFEIPLIDRSLLPLAPEEIMTVELVEGSRRVTLQRRGQDWTAEGLAPGKAQELGDSILALRAQQAVHLGPARPEEALRPALTFVAKNGARHVVELGARGVLGELPIVYARSSGVRATFALAASTAQALRDF